MAGPSPIAARYLLPAATYPTLARASTACTRIQCKLILCHPPPTDSAQYAYAARPASATWNPDMGAAAAVMPQEPLPTPTTRAHVTTELVSARSTPAALSDHAPITTAGLCKWKRSAR